MGEQKRRWYFIVKSELINETWLATHKQIEKNKIEYIINIFIKIINRELKNNNEIKIEGLGTFSPNTVKQTYIKKNVCGDKAKIIPKKYINFKPSKKLKKWTI